MLQFHRSLRAIQKLLPIFPSLETTTEVLFRTGRDSSCYVFAGISGRFGDLLLRHLSLLIHLYSPG